MHDDIQKAIETLKSGGVILYPTDTIWGLGCDATNAEAVKKIYQIKQRDDSKSMLVLLDHFDKIGLYLKEVPELASDLVEMAEKPLTIIYPGAVNIAKNLIAEDGSVGIRVCADDFCQKLISRFRKPIVSTSANISGQPSPAIFDEISDDIRNAADFVVQWRQNDRTPAKPSSIIKLGIKGEIAVIRE